MESLALVFILVVILVLFLGLFMLIYKALGALLDGAGSERGLLMALLAILSLSWLFGGDDGDAGC